MVLIPRVVFGGGRVVPSNVTLRRPREASMTGNWNEVSRVFLLHELLLVVLLCVVVRRLDRGSWFFFFCFSIQNSRTQRERERKMLMVSKAMTKPRGKDDAWHGRGDE